METPEIILSVSHLTKDYGSGRGVFDVSFDIRKGECFGYLGPNGAGKSTTIRHIMGFSKPDAGEIRVFDLESWSKYHKILKRVGYVPGEIALPYGLNGNQFLAIQKELFGDHDPERLKELMNRFELTEEMLKIDTKKMSLGVKRKLAIVAAFMTDPDFLILDEPTSGLDQKMQQVFIDYIRMEKERGKTILLSSHIFSEVDAVCDRVAIIKDGKIVSSVTTSDLHNASFQTYRITFASLNDLRTFRDECAGSIVQDDEEKLTLSFVEDDSNINSLLVTLSKYKIASFSNRKESLQDYFMKFYNISKEFEGVQ